MIAMNPRQTHINRSCYGSFDASYETISYLSELASFQTVTLSDHRSLRIQLIADAAAAIIVLLAITTISVYKPRGQVRFGILLPRFKATTRKPLGFYLLPGFALAITIFILLHLMNGGMHH